MKVLILCTGNSCRSQMAHGFLQSFDKDLIVRSAGTAAAGTACAGVGAAATTLGEQSGAWRSMMCEAILSF